MASRRRSTGTDVLNEAIDRMIRLYADGHRIVVSFSGGKDSGVCLEICRIAAAETGRGPVEVLMRDEEIMFPGTFEYAERLAQQDDIDMHWIYARQPVINCFNRSSPYFWVFDPTLDPDDWVRKPPDFAYEIPEKNIDAMVIPDRFPPDEGKELFSVIGLRIQESFARRKGLFSSGGYTTKPQKYGVRRARPIYDWSDGDIWKAVFDMGWDYNSAYDVMYRHGLKAKDLRIGPPTMNMHGAENLAMARVAWPKWFDRLENRLPGVRTVAQFGKRAVTARRKLGETWEETYMRECIEEAPDWIAERAVKTMELVKGSHRSHASTPVPDVNACSQCPPGLQSWSKMVAGLYLGDPFSTANSALPYMEPEFFRAGAGTWGGKPAF